jgi:arylformamidase
MTTGPGDDWARMPRPARDAAYNNTAAVKDSARILAERAAASAEFRARRPRGLDIAYGPRERNRWDIFPAASANAPCLVYIHGGYWQRNSRESISVLAEGVMAHGWAAAFPGYTLAPDATLTQIVAEIRAALDWMAATGPTHGIAGPIFLSGWSAGGHLTAMALDHARVAAGLSISGVFELGRIRDTYLDEKLKLTDDEVETLSPLRLPVVDKPMALAYGTAELPRLVADSRTMHARRAASHAAGNLVPIPGANHFTILDELQSPDGRITRELLGLLAAR